jgi:hypothetical protein
MSTEPPKTLIDWIKALSLDRKIYYVVWLLIAVFLFNAWRDARSTGGVGFADLVVLVVIIWCSIAFVISFILSHLLLKRWYTLSIPVSFVLAQILIVSAVRSQSMPKEKKEKFLSVLGVKPSPL